MINRSTGFQKHVYCTAQFRHKKSSKNWNIFDTKIQQKWDHSGGKSSLKNRNNLGTKIRKKYSQNIEI